MLLQHALTQGAFDYPPAWRLKIDLDLRKPTLDKQAVLQLPAYARRLAQTTGPWPTEGSKLEFAEYLGVAVGYCQYVSSSGSKLATEITAVDREISEVLPIVARQAYDAGKSTARASAEGASQQAARETEEQKAASQSRQSEVEFKTQTGKQAIDDKEEKLVRDKGEKDRQWEQQKKEFLKEQQTFDSNLQILANSMAQLEKAIQSYEPELARLRLSLANKPLGGSQSDQVTRGIEQTISQMVFEQSRLRLQWQEKFQQGQAELYKKKNSVQLFGAAEREYHLSTGQMLKESDELSRARKALRRQTEREAKRKRAPAKNSVAGSGKFSFYAPLDVELERQRIVQSYAKP